jgi:hypothetical protein
MLRSFAPFVFALALAGSAAAQDFSSLEERMSDAEFRGAGLDKLSPEELDRLNEWLRTRLGGVPRTAVPADSQGFRAESGIFNDDGMDRGEVVSRTEGDFSGWNQNTVVRLENGQWWQVTEPQSFSIPKQSQPTITISPAMLGSWLMKVEGYNRSVRVTRIR